MKHIAGTRTSSTISELDSASIQPNAIDLRAAKIMGINNAPFSLSEQDKKHRGSFEIPTFPDINGLEWWHLMPGAYEVVFSGIVNIGENEVGWVVPRSTLVRNGIFVTSGLYDTGYHGSIGCCMHITSGSFELQQGTRIAQFVLFDAESVKKYDGSYGIDPNGQLKAGEEKYIGEN